MPADLSIVEAYAQDMMTSDGESPALIAHDYKHADRVRRWALRIAEGEGYPDLYAVEVAALLHDIGLVRANPRRLHGEIGAKLAEQFLVDNRLANEQQLDEIIPAIRYHNSLERKGLLLDIIRDADALDLLGAVGIWRGLTSMATMPDYPADNIRGETAGFSARDFDARFNNGTGIGTHIIDQINFQITCYENIATDTAREIAQPRVAFMQDYLEQFFSEVG